MNTRELRSLTDKELEGKIAEIDKELMKLNGQVATGTTPKSPGQIKQLRKTLARIYTIQKEKENKKA